MLYCVKYVASYLLGTDVAGRNLKVFPDDTFIASFPRSGNTWKRFLIANLMHPDRQVTFANIESMIPDSSALSSRAMKRVPRPRLVKTHEYFDPRYPKVIYLVRDPRDVALSLYNFRRKYRSVPDTYPLEQYVSERFVPGDLHVSWGEHVGGWLGTRRRYPRFLLGRYEDLLTDPPAGLRRIADFLGIDAGAAALERATQRSGSAAQARVGRARAMGHDKGKPCGRAFYCRGEGRCMAREAPDRSRSHSSSRHGGT